MQWRNFIKRNVYFAAGDAAKNVAVAVGISYTEYYLNSSHQPMSAYTATSGTLSVVCGRLSFTLGLKASLLHPTRPEVPRDPSTLVSVHPQDLGLCISDSPQNLCLYEAT